MTIFCLLSESENWFFFKKIAKNYEETAKIDNLENDEFTWKLESDMHTH